MHLTAWGRIWSLNTAPPARRSRGRPSRARRPSAPGRYLDPVSLASLIVSIASLTWTIYNDRRTHSPEPPPSESIARQVRITLASRTRPCPSRPTAPPRSSAAECPRHSYERSPAPGTDDRPCQQAAATQKAPRWKRRRLWSPAIRKAHRRNLQEHGSRDVYRCRRRRAGHGPADRSHPCRDQAEMLRGCRAVAAHSQKVTRTTEKPFCTPSTNRTERTISIRNGGSVCRYQWA